MALLKNGTASGSPFSRMVLMPMLKVFNASRDGVVASTGTSNFCTDASDSPNLVRKVEADLSNACRSRGHRQSGPQRQTPQGEPKSSGASCPLKDFRRASPRSMMETEQAQWRNRMLVAAKG